MRKRHLLSANGSDRATAYNVSSKIVRRGGELYVTWLEAPVEVGAPGWTSQVKGELVKVVYSAYNGDSIVMT